MQLSEKDRSIVANILKSQNILVETLGINDLGSNLDCYRLSLATEITFFHQVKFIEIRVSGKIRIRLRHIVFKCNDYFFIFCFVNISLNGSRYIQHLSKIHD